MATPPLDAVRRELDYLRGLPADLRREGQTDRHRDRSPQDLYDGMARMIENAIQRADTALVRATLRAYKVTYAGTTAHYAGSTPGKARYAAYCDLRDMQRGLRFSDLRVVRAPTYDGLAAQESDGQRLSAARNVSESAGAGEEVNE